ncbi:insulin receptor substrate 1 [Ambystoma mexicanum]|uniref:insulin receptor substrate 1 n=1 Tax=Ambystoma mexicanum TaxID=8296 RepID=UPI0037E93C0C
MASPPEPSPPPDAGGGFSDVRKVGYLRKPKSMHKRFFVLRGSSAAGPARLEYYESEKKWRHKAAAPKRCIRLDGCLNIHKRADAKHKHLLALYTREECFSLAAETPQEQEGWYRSLLQELRAGSPEPEHRGGATTGPAFREVWQVILKPKGLGQSRNLTGVYRLCLGPRTLSLVKLHAEAAALVLQLMNIRRCGHSEGFFFVELGRSASTGPGELWMQVDDAVVAQSMHETILEAMRALSDEFRPRSKSQSAKLCSNPISVPLRRPQPPPSQSGLGRQTKTGPFRVRASSDGEGSRPASGDGSPASPGRAHSSASCCPRPQRLHPPLSHSRSIPASACRCSPSAAASPASLSSSSTSGHGSTSDVLCPRRSSASVSGSPSDGGFISSDEYGSSPSDFRGSFRSATPDSPGHTPPADGLAYICMGRGPPLHRRPPAVQDPGFRKRTHSAGTSPPPPLVGQLRPSCPSCAEDYTTMMPPCRLSAFLPPHCYPEERSQDDGYMPMSPGVAPSPARPNDYMPMSPTSVSAPQKILRPRRPCTDPSGYMMMSPSGSCSPEGCGAQLSLESGDGKLPCGDYMNMSPASGSSTSTPPDGYILPEEASQPACSYYSLPRSFKHLHRPAGEDSSSSTSSDSLGGQDPTGKPDMPVPTTTTRLPRPTRLSLDKASTLPRAREHPEPKSPGEYVNIDFNSSNSLYSPTYIEGRVIPQRESLSEYMNMELGSLGGRDYMSMQPGAATSDCTAIPPTSRMQHADTSVGVTAESRNKNEKYMLTPTSSTQSISNFGAVLSESVTGNGSCYLEMPPTSNVQSINNCSMISVDSRIKNYVQRPPASRVSRIGNYGVKLPKSRSDANGDYVEMPATSKVESIGNYAGLSADSRTENGSDCLEMSSTARTRSISKDSGISAQSRMNKNHGVSSPEFRTENDSNYVEMPPTSRAQSITKFGGMSAELGVNHDYLGRPPTSRSQTKSNVNHHETSDSRKENDHKYVEVPPTFRVQSINKYGVISVEPRMPTNYNYAEIASVSRLQSAVNCSESSSESRMKIQSNTYLGRPPLSRVQKVNSHVTVVQSIDYAEIPENIVDSYAEPPRSHSTCCPEVLSNLINRSNAVSATILTCSDVPSVDHAHSTYAEMACVRGPEKALFPKPTPTLDLSSPSTPAPLPGQGSGLSAFTRVNLSPGHSTRVVRVDPQGRRRHSSETFSSTPSAARGPPSLPYTEDSKRHSSASFENVSLKADSSKELSGVALLTIPVDTLPGLNNSEDTSLKLNYIDLDLGRDLSSHPSRSPGQSCAASTSDDLGPYARISFQKSGDFRSTSAKEE